MSTQQTALVWFTDNLRAHDNPALVEACNRHPEVIGVYVLEREVFEGRQFGFRKIEKFRARFLLETLKDLRVQLEKLNIPLVVRYGDSASVVSAMCARYQVSKLHHQVAWTKEEIDRVENMKRVLPSTVKMVSYVDQCLFHPEDVPLSISEVPEVFTVFRKIVEKKASVREVLTIPDPRAKMPEVEMASIPTLEALGFEDFELPAKAAFHEKGGETAALARLQYYSFGSKKLSYYKKTRNGLVGPDYSIKASPWLANGSLSPRTMYWLVKDYEKDHGSNQSTYWMIFELIWRDYFKYLATKHGGRLFYLDGFKRKHYHWSQDASAIEAWVEGRTDAPFVNANMIELKRTGWMSNRGRQNVASYFAKTMQLDWRIGAAYFEAMLVDYDVHSNYGNWQYVAGVGNDPRDRVFNVQLQAQRYDPHGTYQRMWLQRDVFG